MAQREKSPRLSKCVDEKRMPKVKEKISVDGMIILNWRYLGCVYMDIEVNSDRFEF